MPRLIIVTGAIAVALAFAGHGLPSDEPGPASLSVPVAFGPGGEAPAGVDATEARVATIEANFDMVGLLWDSGTVESLWAQFRNQNGEWGDWIELSADDDHAPDDAEGRPGADPVYTGGSTAVRFVMSGDVSGAEAMMLNTGAISNSSPSPPVGLSETGSNPPSPSWPGASFVRNRSTWDTNGCRRAGAETSYSSARAIVIHHTAASNNYTEADVAGIIRGHCEFHVNGRGWDDIGYNFLVDRFGNVWEGRTGSKYAPVSGAHTAGFNGQTQGVAMLGNFDSEPPPAELVSGLRQMLDWLTGWHSINPTGTLMLTAKSSSTRFDEGDEITVPSIIGHRDLGSTSCPGDYFYTTLATLRTQITPIGFGFVPSQLRCDGLPVTLFGTPGNDVIYGTDGPDVIHGIFGDDWIFGLGGDDRICGDTGADRLVGSSGNDRVFGGSGVDACGGENRTGCESLTNDEIFFYREDGLFRFYDIATNGKVGSPIAAGNSFPAGWSTVTALDLDGDGQDELFLYRSDGQFSYRDVNPDGSLGATLRSGTGYTTGWDAIVGIDLDGDSEDEMFFYRSDGLYRFYDVGLDGALPPPFLAGSGYTTGWDVIQAADLDGDRQDEMFFYRGDGLFRYYQVNPDGTLPSPLLAGSGYTTGWSSISAVDLDGDEQDEMFFYRDDGLFRYYHINVDGTLPSPLLAGAGYTTGWDVIAAFELRPAG